VDTNISIVTVIDLEDVFRLTLDCNDEIFTELAFTKLTEGKTGVSLTHGQILNNSSKMFEINVALEENKHRQKILHFLTLAIFLALKEVESKRQTDISELLIPPPPVLEAREYSKNHEPKRNDLQPLDLSKKTQTKGKPGRPHYKDDIWAHDQVFSHHKPPDKIKLKWLSRVKRDPRRRDIDKEELNRQFRRIMERNWGTKAG
jgi:hypothetical protein